MNYKVTYDDLYKYVINGWDMSVLTKFQIENLPKDIINKRAAKGGDLSEFSNDRINDIPQYYINKRVENGGDLSDLTSEKIKNIPQSIVNKLAAKGGDISRLAENQIRNIPQLIINKSVAKGMEFKNLTEEQIKNIPQKYVNSYVKKSNSLNSLFSFTLEQLNEIPQEIINKRVAKGNINLNKLTKSQLENLSQDSINKYFELGGNLGYLTLNQRNAIPQEIINERVAKNKVDLDKLTPSQRNNLSLSSIISYFSNKGSLEKLTLEQIEAIPQEVINERVTKGNLNLNKLTQSQIENIPQECINKYVENSMDLTKLSPKQLSQVSQESINKFVENGGNLSNIFSEHKFKNVPLECYIRRASNVDKDRLLLPLYNSGDILKKIPKEILISTNKGKNALILFSIGKIKTEDLPLDVFVNYDLRKTFIEIARTKVLKKFNKLCIEKGYIDIVPPKFRCNFENQIQNIYNAIIRRRESAIKNLLNYSSKKAATTEIQNGFKNVNEEFKSVNEDSNYYKEEGLKQLLAKQEK